MIDECAVTFRLMNHKVDRTVTCKVGDTLLDVALDAGIDLPHECGGNCACTTCMVVVLKGEDNLSPMEEPEVHRLMDENERMPNARLGCQAIVLRGDIVVTLPAA